MSEKKLFDKFNNKTVYGLFVFLTGLLASLPLILKGIDGAPYQDLAFHLSRIEGIKEGLLAGKFPVMMQSVWMDGKGYPVSIFYGDALLYFPAILRIIGIPVVASYKIYVLVINILTAAVACKCFKEMFKDRKASLFGTVLYMSINYRFVDIYVRNAVGEYTAFLFFPIVALAMYRILSKETEDKGYCIKNSLLLCLGMTGLIETHLLSTVMTAFLIGIVCLLYIKRTFRKRTILCLAMAVGETILVNLYFLVPFLDYYISEPIYGGKGGDHSAAMQIRGSGAYVSQLFDFFARPFGINVADVEYRMQLTVGLPLLIVLLAAFVVFVIKERHYRTFVLGFLSVLTLVMSTNLFPWNSLEGYTRLFKLLSKVQFPWRYLAPAAFFIVLLFCDIYVRLEKEEKFKKILAAFSWCITVLCIVMSISFTLKYAKDYVPVNHHDYSEVDSGYMGACEYLKNNTSLADLVYVPMNEGFEKWEIVSQKDNTVNFYVKNGMEEQKLEVQKLNYKGYVATAGDKTKLKSFDGFNDLITVMVPAGYDGNIKVTFKQPVYWVIAEIISLLSVAVFLYLLHNCRKKDPQ